MKKILIDTNYILRFFIQDIKDQYVKAKEIFKEIENEKATGIISLLVVNELIWIMENFYELKRKEYIPQILKLLSLKKIKIMEIKKEQLILVLKEMKTSKLDFTDLYLKNCLSKDTYKLKSFDKELTKLI